MGGRGKGETGPSTLSLSGLSRMTRRRWAPGCGGPAAGPWALWAGGERGRGRGRREVQGQRVRFTGVRNPIPSSLSLSLLSLSRKLTDGHPLGVDRAQVCVLKQVDDKVLGRLRGLETKGGERDVWGRSLSLFPSPPSSLSSHLLQRQQGLRRPPEGFGRDAVGDLAGLCCEVGENV